MLNNKFSADRAGFTLIELLVVIAIIGTLVALLMPAVQSARESARRTQCSNNLKQLALAVAEYEGSHKVLPSSDHPKGLTNAPVVSGLMLLLPYIGKTAKYDSYDFTKDWSDDSGPDGGNLALTTGSVPGLLCPSTPYADRLDGKPDDNPWTGKIAATDYSPIIGVDYRLGPTSHEPSPGLVGELGLVDPQTITYSSTQPPIPNSGLLCKYQKTRFADARDGMSVTMLFAESAGRPYLYWKGNLAGNDLATNRVNGGGWARHESDFILNGASSDGATLPGPCPLNCTNGNQAAGLDYPLPHYGTEGTGEAYGFHSGGAFFAFADGAVHFISSDIDIREFAKLVAKNDHKDITGVDF